MENFKPKFSEEALPRISRKEFDALDLRDQSRFCLMPNSVIYDDPEPERQLGANQITIDQYNADPARYVSDIMSGKLEVID